MEIIENFVRDILKADYPEMYQKVYDGSLLLQYLDKKMKAVHGDSKTRRSLANIYAIYSILHFYQADYFENPERYKEFEGYDYMRLFRFYRGLYGGSKLQNHALNSRVNGEFKNRYPDSSADLIIVNNGKHLIHIDYLRSASFDISRTCCKIIEKYIKLLTAKDHVLLDTLERISLSNDYEEKRRQITNTEMQLRKLLQSMNCGHGLTALTMWT